MRNCRRTSLSPMIVLLCTVLSSGFIVTKMDPPLYMSRISMWNLSYDETVVLINQKNIAAITFSSGGRKIFCKNNDEFACAKAIFQPGIPGQACHLFIINIEAPGSKFIHLNSPGP